MYDELVAGATGISLETMLKIRADDRLMVRLPNDNFSRFDVLCLNEDSSQRYGGYADVAARWTEDDPIIDNVIATVQTWRLRAERSVA
jgi:hypothetical protein